MALMRTSNPALNDRAFRPVPGTQFGSGWSDATERMTVSGTANKTGILLLCAAATASWTWFRFMQSHNPTDVAGWMMIGLIGGLIFSMVTIFKPVWAPITAPAYAALEGLAMGGISAMFELRYPGVAIQSVGLTFATLAVLLMAYRSGLIRMNDKLRIGIIAATGGIALFYLAQMVLGFFHITFTTINGSGPIGILFSLVVVGVAAMNLVLDFDVIERGAQSGAPKYMEWYGAFSLMLTLVWLYLEMLRLLSKIRSRN